MQSKRIWQSAVARILSRKWNGLPAPDVIAMLAREVRGSLKQSKRADLNAICATVGVSIQYKPLGVDALLQEMETGYIASINSASSKVRQRFSIAHEVGHVMLYNATGLAQAFGHLSPNERKSSEAIEIEELCNRFAAELLMPIADWQKQIFSEGISLKVIRRLMSRYEVSISAAARRVIDAEVWKCAIVIWTPISQGDFLTELKPVQCCENITRGGHAWPRVIPNTEEFRIPGSPLYALEKKTETKGKMPLPFDMMGGNYLAQSDIVYGQPFQVATLMIPESYGWEIILRSDEGNQRTISKKQSL